MIVGYINKLGNTAGNKKFIQNRHRLEKKFKSSSFLYSSKNASVIILYKNLNEYNFYEDDRFIVYINGTIGTDKYRLKAENVFLEFRLNDEFPLEKFEGSFQIFIFDKIKKNFFCITDYFNTHKFYIKNKKNEIIITTNLGLPILLRIIKKEFSENFFYRYTLGNYRSSHGRLDSPIKELNSLPANSIAKFSYKFDLEIKSTNDKNKISKKFNFFEIKNLLNNYFKRFYSQFSKKKKICLLMSGGFDSTLITHYWKKYFKTDMNAYTIYFKNQQTKDTALSKLISNKSNINQTLVNFSKKNLISSLNKVYKKYDYPIATVSQLAFIDLYDHINRKYDTIITGYGGDYLFGGSYNSFLYNLSDLRKKSKKEFNLELNYWIKNHSTNLFPKNKKIFKKFEKKFCKKKQGIINDVFREEVDFKRLLNKKINIKNYKCNIKSEKKYLETYTKWAYKFESVSPVADTELLLDFHTDFKTISPFISKELQNLSLNTPSNLKIKKGVNRIFIRKLLKNTIYKKIINEKDKFGFNCPLDKWIQEDKEIFNYIKKKLFKEKSICMKIYGKNFLEKILISHKNKKKNYSMVIWQLLNYQLWYDEWMKKEII